MTLHTHPPASPSRRIIWAPLIPSRPQSSHSGNRSPSPSPQPNTHHPFLVQWTMQYPAQRSKAIYLSSRPPSTPTYLLCASHSPYLETHLALAKQAVLTEFEGMILPVRQKPPSLKLSAEPTHKHRSPMSIMSTSIQDSWLMLAAMMFASPCSSSLSPPASKRRHLKPRWDLVNETWASGWEGGSFKHTVSA